MPVEELDRREQHASYGAVVVVEDGYLWRLKTGDVAVKFKMAPQYGELFLHPGSYAAAEGGENGAGARGGHEKRQV